MNEFKQVSTSKEIEHIRAISYSYLIYRRVVSFVDELRERDLEEDITVIYIMTDKSTDILIIAEDPKTTSQYIKKRLEETNTVFSITDYDDKNYLGYASLMILKEDEKTFPPRIVNFFFKKEVNNGL